MFALIVCFTVCSLQDVYFGSHFAVLVILDFVLYQRSEISVC